ncbi:MAG TPA: hypothetical protein VJ978_13385 [Nitriliruptoraceae bacterium]|nr:hypothetical protein [Nitriliruptoraceae bacterium]
MTPVRRHRLTRRSIGLALAAVVLAACGGGDDTDATTSESPADQMESEADDMASDDMAGDEMSDHATDEMTDAPASSEATEAAGDDAAPASGVVAITATAPDGSTVSPADFAGTPVFVETFATWCSNCRSQLGDTNEAAGQVGDDAVFLALSVETDLDPAALETYAADNGFSNVVFGVLTREDLATLEAEFGNAVLVPPSTPKFTVAADGSVGELTTGFESVDEILGQL